MATLTAPPVYKRIRVVQGSVVKGARIRQKKNETWDAFVIRRQEVSDDVNAWSRWRNENREVLRAQRHADSVAKHAAINAGTTRQKLTGGAFASGRSVMDVTAKGDLEQLRDGVEVLTGRRTQGRISNRTSGVGQEHDGDWQVELAVGQPWEAVVHEFGHVKYTQFDQPAILESNQLIRSLWGAIEDGRIDRMAGAYFGKPLLEVHQDALAVADPSTYTSDDEALVLGAAQIAMGMERKRSTFMGAEMALDAYADDIVQASTGTDPAGPVDAAIKIAEFIGMLADQTPPQGEEPREDGEPGGPRGEGQGGGNGSGPSDGTSTTGPSASGQDDGGGEPDTDEPYEQDDEPTGGAGTEPKQQAPPPPPPPPTPQQQQQMKDAVEQSTQGSRDTAGKQITASIQRQSQVTAKAKSMPRFGLEYGQLVDPKNPDNHRSHAVTLIQPKLSQLEPLTTSESMRLMLEGLPEPTDVPKRELYGQPTPDVWKLNIGKTRVFERTPKTRGRIVVLVDMSSSMLSGNSDLAWDIIGALSARQHSIEVYGYFNAQGVYIVQVPEGMKPVQNAIFDWTGDTPDCAALLWLREHLAGDMAQTTAVLISDGHPNVPCADPRGHTRRLAQEMYDEGMRYASILLGYHNNIYPSDVVVQVDTTDDLGKVQDIFTYLQEVR